MGNFNYWFVQSKEVFAFLWGMLNSLVPLCVSFHSLYILTDHMIMKVLWSFQYDSQTCVSLTHLRACKFRAYLYNSKILVTFSTVNFYAGDVEAIWIKLLLYSWRSPHDIWLLDSISCFSWNAMLLARIIYRHSLVIRLVIGYLAHVLTKQMHLSSHVKENSCSHL